MPQRLSQATISEKLSGHCLYVMLWMFANGLDTSPVSNIGAKSLIKSIGNSTTAPHDLITDEEIRVTLMVLCESVSARIQEVCIWLEKYLLK